MKPLPTLTRSGVREWLQGRYWLRLHMFVIVAVTFGAGLVATWTLMRLGVHVLALRYAIAVCSAYLVFLALVRLWIWFACSDGTVDLDPFDVVEVGVEVADSAPSLEVASPSDAGNLSLDIGDPEGCVGVVVLAALAALFILAGGYLIYTAPAILAEAAFEALLAAALARRETGSRRRVGGVGVPLHVLGVRHRARLLRRARMVRTDALPRGFAVARRGQVRRRCACTEPSLSPNQRGYGNARSNS